MKNTCSTAVLLLPNRSRFTLHGGSSSLISGSKNTEYIVSGLAVNSKCLLQDVTICADKIHKMFDLSDLSAPFLPAVIRAGGPGHRGGTPAWRLRPQSWQCTAGPPFRGPELPASRPRSGRSGTFQQLLMRHGSAVHRGGPHSSSSGGNAPADGAQRRMPPYRPKSGYRSSPPKIVEHIHRIAATGRMLTSSPRISPCITQTGLGGFQAEKSW